MFWSDEEGKVEKKKWWENKKWLVKWINEKKMDDLTNRRHIYVHKLQIKIEMRIILHLLIHDHEWVA